MHLQQHRQAQLARQGHKLDQTLRRQSGCYQEYRVGTGRARLIHLPGVDDKIFAEYRQGHLAADGLDVVQFALEILLVGQHADSICTGCGIGPGDSNGVESLADKPFRRRGFFDLGYQVHASARLFCQSGEEVSHRRSLERPGLEMGQVCAVMKFGDLLLLGF